MDFSKSISFGLIENIFNAISASKTSRGRAHCLIAPHCRGRLLAHTQPVISVCRNIYMIDSTDFGTP